MKGKPLSDFCVYTIRQSGRLKAEYRKGIAKFTENKGWKTASVLFQRATKAGQRMPIVFAAAESIEGLIYWGIITDLDINLETKKTRVTAKALRRIRNVPPLSSLTVRSTRQKLPDNYIRSYVICQTPSFLKAD